MKIDKKCQEAFKDWAESQPFIELCLDQIFMSTNGVPENPYTDCQTRLLYEAWGTAWKKARKTRNTK